MTEDAMSRIPDNAIPESPAESSGPGIAEMINPDLLQEFQDNFANVLGVSVIIRDVDGNPVTKPAAPGKFCSLLLKTRPNEAPMDELSLKLSRRAVTSGHVERARDDMGFLEFAAPITVQGRPVGALVIGNVFDDDDNPEKIATLAREMHADASELRRATFKEISLAVSFMQFAASALADLCHEGWTIRRHVQELQTLLHVSELLNSTRHLNEVLPLIVRTVADTLSVKATGLRLLEPNTGEMVLKAVHNLSEEYLAKGPVHARRSEIDQEAMEGNAVYVRDIAKDPRILYPREMLREGIRSILVVGLKVRGRPIGALRIYAGEKRHFHRSEIALAEAIANLAGIAIENAKLYEEALEKQRLEHELNLAAQIQSHLLPATQPKLKGFEIHALNDPCRQVGGDFFDFFPFDGDQLGLVIADVCGKSMAGALLMATARSSLRVQCEHFRDPAEIVTRVNRSLCRDTRSEEFVTLLFGKLDRETKVLHYSNAGHNRPVVYRGDETIRLEVGGMVCGVLAENQYQQSEIQLQSGDIVLLYTDGLDEARNPEEQLFGLQRASDYILANRDFSSREIVEGLASEVHRFARTREQSDDLTLILIKVA